jgi:hypothetical protein
MRTVTVVYVVEYHGAGRHGKYRIRKFNRRVLCQASPDAWGAVHRSAAADAGRERCGGEFSIDLGSLVGS